MSRRLLVAMIGFAVGAALLRYSWAILLLAVLVLAEPRWSARRLLRSVVAGAALTIAVPVVVAGISAPGGSAPFERISNVLTDPIGGARDLLTSTRQPTYATSSHPGG